MARSNAISCSPFRHVMHYCKTKPDPLTRAAIGVLRRPVGAANEGLELRREEDVHGPPAAALRRLHVRHLRHTIASVRECAAEPAVAK